MRTLLLAQRFTDGRSEISFPWVLLEDGLLLDFDSTANRPSPAADQTLDLTAATLTPSFFDVHIHGAKGHDLMEATPQAMTAVSGYLATRGVGQFLATTVTASVDETLRALDGLARLLDQPQMGATPVGIHLEGPFLSHKKRGVHPPNHLQVADRKLFDRFWQASAGKIRLMTLAPEIEGAEELVRYVSGLGVRVSVGHSDADSATTRCVIDAGARSATHTFNAMRPLDHREPGILGTVLVEDRLYAEIICDGIHVHPDMVKLWWRAKGSERGILMTDGMSATGMPNGTYMLGEFEVEVSEGRAMSGGVLAGSVLTMDLALQNFLRFTGASLDDAIGLLTRNPRAMSGYDDLQTALRKGAPANLNLIGENGTLLASVIGGKIYNSADQAS